MMPACRRCGGKRNENVTMDTSSGVVIEAALNGGRDRTENKAVPYTAHELAVEARRCADAGATVFHIHARAEDGGWTADPARYADVMGACARRSLMGW